MQLFLLHIADTNIRAMALAVNIAKTLYVIIFLQKNNSIIKFLHRPCQVSTEVLLNSVMLPKPFAYW